ncbi:CotH kinase family protein [Ruminococcus flavefaciens]|uniref:CotH kinase family protein n=1 Tax=Ruminococcus flavefaciens TaxID=1265 RepID=UPI0026EDC59D|nr:CotH kinase family protein [Ruminococcus flavefaciens]
MEKILKKRSVAGLVCLGILLQNAAYLPANADSASQISFNEICSKNTACKAADGSCYDWVELYNNGKTDADISGWGLSDKETEPYKYVFPDGTNIPANGRLMVFCDSDGAKNNAKIAPFGLSSSGETLTLTDTKGNIAQTITFEAIPADSSYGQYPDGSGQYYMLSCTPEKANTAPEGSAAVHKPAFSHDSGFYDSSFSLTLTADEGCDIYYTTDGSNPVWGSKKYTEPLTIKDMTDTENRLSARTDIVPDGGEAPRGNVDKAVVIRAVAVDSENHASEYVTKTYLIGKTNSGYYKNMKVVSLVTDPANLFDKDKGIYCLGKIYEENRHADADKWPWEKKANYSMKGREWERPAIFTMFENGEKVIEENVGIRIKGAFSRSLAQKSFNVYTRKEYGSSEFDYDFFSGRAVKAKNGKAIKKYDGIVLRNGGNDNTAAFFRDSINQSLVADRGFAHQATTECIVLLDGEFWGIYQMMEKINTGFLSSHYGVNKDDIAIIENGQLEEGTDKDLSDWRQLCDGVANGNISFEEFCNKVDLQGFMDYFAAQIYWSNADWPQNNFSAWRSNKTDESNPYADGKWRMILFDTESGQGLYGSDDKSYHADGFERLRNNNSQLARLFKGLMKNESFKMKFARTMMDLANNNFNTDKTTAVINSYKNSYRQQIADTYARFHSGSLSGENAIRRFESEMATVTEFYNKRYSYAERTTRSAMNIPAEPHKLTVVNSPDYGSITLNSIQLGKINRWSGNYHADYDLHLTAVPVEGKTFSHWNLNGAKLSGGELTDPYIRVRIEADATVEAVYEGQANAQTTTKTTTTTKAVTTTAAKTTSTTKAATTPAKTTAAVTTTKKVTTTAPKASSSGLRTLGKVIQAETFDYKSGIDTENCSEGGLDVAYIENGEYIGFKNVDLTGVHNIDFRIGSNGAKAVLEVHTDKPDGQMIGKMDIKGTDGWQTWATQRCSVSEVSGSHDLYFVFKGGEGYLYNVNWWRTDKAAEKYAVGDLNGDGTLDSYDLCRMKRAVLSGDADNFGAADINGDDVINRNDLDLLRKFIMGEIKSF